MALLMSGSIILAQNINLETINVSFHQLPLKPLKPSSNTYSVSLEDLGAELTPYQRDSLRERGLLIPGYVKIKEGGSIQLELIVSPLSVTNKEVKDVPLETEKDGKKITTHQYWYSIAYAFPTKLRISLDGNLLGEQELPSFFTTEYYPQNRTSLTVLQQSYDNDFYFLNNLKQKHVDQRVNEIRKWLASNYGYTTVNEMIDIGYVKDKKGLYEDLTKALSLIQNAFKYANGKKKYLDDSFRNQINEAVAILNNALLESSTNKKARINQRVTAMINYNLALCSYGLNEFDQAKEYLNKVGKTGINIMGASRILDEKIEDKRKRFIANGLITDKSVNPKEIIQPVITEKSTSQNTLLSNKSVRNYIVAKPGDTLEVRFILPSSNVMPFGDSIWLQDQIIVVKNEKKVTLYPGEIHSYSYNGVVRESLTWVKDMSTNPWTFEKRFCKKLLTGAIPVFNCYQVRNSFRDPTEKYVEATIRYIRPDNHLGEFGLINFNKWVAKLVSKYPALSEKIRAGEYQKTDSSFLEIIREYNSWIKEQPIQ